MIRSNEVGHNDRAVAFGCREYFGGGCGGWKPGYVTECVAQGWPERTPDDVALLQITGGTTGDPRGVMLTNRNITGVNSIYQNLNEGWGDDWRSDDHVLISLPCARTVAHVE
jgi:acyl-CoA synthetase (AMP-forming)/AMP-acid ligase II